jgi:hypothetical protein
MPPGSSDLPDDRDYDNEDDRHLDEQLEDAIAIADGADNELMAGLLQCLLWTHYHQTR